MSNSLFDQLKKSGLVDEKKAKKVSQDKRVQAKKNRKNKNEAQEDENKQRAKQAAAEKAARDKELNRQRNEAAEQKAIQAQIRQLIETNRIAREEKPSDVAFNFADQKKVQKIYVSDQLQTQLSRGRLAIVKLDDRYELVPYPVAEKIKQRDEVCVVFCSELQSQEADEDDPYADFQIPDDLMW